MKNSKMESTIQDHTIKRFSQQENALFSVISYVEIFRDKYNRIPLIRTLVIRIASYLDLLGP